MGCGRGSGDAFPRTGLLLSVVFVLAGPGVVPGSGPLPPRSAPAPDPDPPRPSLVVGHFLDEGFDAPAFPPTDWTHVAAASPPHTWHRTEEAANVHTGSAAAIVRWQNDRVQDELLLTPALDLRAAPPSGLRLSFWWRTNPFWFHGANTHFWVHASLDGSAWDEIWSVEGQTGNTWAWRNAVLDLSSYAGVEGDLRLRFKYKGRDSADLALDEVKIGYLDPPGPPANDDCAGALASGHVLGPDPGPFAVTGNTLFATLDYPLAAGTSCTGYAHAGNDVVWVVDLPGEHRLTATMSTAGHWDDTLFLLADCTDPAGSCVAGDRGFPDGSTISFVNPDAVPRRYWLVASGYGAASGQFTLSGDIGPATALASRSWGRVKARYRER